MVLISKALGVYSQMTSNRQNAIVAVETLYHLVQDVGIPTSLKEMGIKKDELDVLSEEAMKQTRLLARSPKPFALQDIRNIYNNAYVGR